MYFIKIWLATICCCNLLFAKSQEVNITSFGIKPNFVRLTVALKNKEVTAVKYTFTKADIGKVIAIKKARIYTEYIGTPLTLNATIIDVKNGKAILEYDQQYKVQNVQNTEALMGTNNFDAIQNALDYCYKTGAKKLNLNYTGTAYVIPFLSSVCKAHATTDAGNKAGFIIKGSIDKTKLKIGGEDLVYTNTSDAFKYDLFYLQAKANGPVEQKTLSDFTIIGADRATPAIRNYNAVFRTNYEDNAVMSVLFKNLDIDGKTGFDDGFNTARGGRWNANGTVKDFCEYQLQNCNWSTYGGISIFAQVPQANASQGAKKLLIENSVLDGGGIPIMKKYKRQASVANNVLTIANPDFSFYNFNSYIPEKSLQPIVALEDAMECVIKATISIADNVKEVLVDQIINEPYTACDVYISDGKQNENYLYQAGQTFAGSNKVRIMAGAKSNEFFKPGAKIRIILKKFKCQVVKILSPSQATVVWMGTPLNFVINTTAIFNDDYRMAEGHAMYIHPNVSCKFKNLTIKNCLKLALHHYSGGGVLGQRLYFDIDGLNVLPSNDYMLEYGQNHIAPMEFTMENNPVNKAIEINNSTFLLYQTEAMLHVKNSKILGGQCGGGSFYNCTGGIDVWGEYPTSFTNCTFEKYSVLRARDGMKLNVTSTNTNFEYLNLQNVELFNATGGKIKTLQVAPKLKERQKQALVLKQVQVVANQ
jgi:hypothetical protein